MRLISPLTLWDPPVPLPLIAFLTNQLKTGVTCTMTNPTVCDWTCHTIACVVWSSQPVVVRVEIPIEQDAHISLNAILATYSLLHVCCCSLLCPAFLLDLACTHTHFLTHFNHSLHSLRSLTHPFTLSPFHYPPIQSNMSAHGFLACMHASFSCLHALSHNHSVHLYDCVTGLGTLKVWLTKISCAPSF